ncbi:unnamed protein product [Musa acuminata subsp. malaccensis]|uniref:Uncharacterized protein n=1 Tax=Musa acuminata subsp. malaccensis TaxID=214687 RepID=A0A804U5K3_MUSAM|nr:unnamed protein product [Musa acuminata subsp. malaccensis]
MGHPNPSIPSKQPTDPSTSVSDLLLPGWLLGGGDGNSLFVHVV